MDVYLIQKILVMKRFIIICAIIFSIFITAYTFQKSQTSITGRVTPIDGANAAWAISGKDSATSNIVNGVFSFAVKQGLYKVIVDAVEPYKDAVLENISVKDGQTVDVGEIVLQK